VDLPRRALPVPGLFEIGQHIIPRPAAIAELGSMVEIVGLAADIDEPVDRPPERPGGPAGPGRRAAEHPAARIRPLVPGSASAVKPQVKLGWSSNFMNPAGMWISGLQSRRLAPLCESYCDNIN
jgi:hypothetical protein